MIIIALLGALLNRVRGGGLTDLVWKYNIAHERDETFWKKFSKHSNDIVFGLVFSFLIGFNFWAFLILVVSMWIGRSWGWGRYIGGIIEEKVRDEQEVEWIDNLVLNEDNYPILRNTIALSFRGLMWSLCIVFGFSIIASAGLTPLSLSFILIAPVGLLMGPTYLFTIKILDQKFNLGSGWGLGEILFGFILWGLIAYIL